MRLGWSPSTRAGLLGTGAMLPSSHAPPNVPPRRRRPRTRSSEGRAGFGRNSPSLGRPRERRPLFGGVYVLVPIWLGAPRPAWQPDPLIERGPAGLFGEVPSHRERYIGALDRDRVTLPAHGLWTVCAISGPIALCARRVFSKKPLLFSQIGNQTL